MKQTENDWSPHRVIFELREVGLSLRQIAFRNEVSPQLLSRALYLPAPKSEQRIARALGLRPRDIWPSRYTGEKRAA